MTAIFGTESFETGPSGAAITAANTGFSSVQAGWVFADSPAPPVGLGTLIAQVDVAAAATSYAQATWTGTPLVFPRMYVRFPSVPSTGTVDIATVRGGTALRARLGISGGKFVLRNGSTVVWTSTMNVPATQWCRLEWRTDNTAGQQQLRIFKGANQHGTTADEDSGSVTFTAGTQVDAVRVGPANNTLTTAWTAFYDAIVVSDITWPGPGYTSPTTPPTGAPTVNAGADQIGVEPWSTVTLTATETGSGITARQWSQLAGTTVTLTGADTTEVTFEAPATLQGDSMQFQYQATYATGSVKDYVDVTVRAVTERAVVGGKEVPMRILHAVDPDPLVWQPDSAWLGGQAWGEH